MTTPSPEELAALQQQLAHAASRHDDAAFYLAASATLLTAVGVLIAVAALVGYYEIRKAATRTAEITAEMRATEVAQAVALETADGVARHAAKEAARQEAADFVPHFVGEFCKQEIDGQEPDAADEIFSHGDDNEQ